MHEENRSYAFINQLEENKKIRCGNKFEGHVLKGVYARETCGWEDDDYI